MITKRRSLVPSSFPVVPSDGVTPRSLVPDPLGEGTGNDETGTGRMRRGAVVGNSAPAPYHLVGLALAGLLLAGCGSSAVVESTPTPTKDQAAYSALVALAGDTSLADRMIDNVCTSKLHPQDFVDQVDGSETWVHLAVLSGCPERKDWTS